MIKPSLTPTLPPSSTDEDLTDTELTQKIYGVISTLHIEFNHIFKVLIFTLLGYIFTNFKVLGYGHLGGYYYAFCWGILNNFYGAFSLFPKSENLCFQLGDSAWRAIFFFK